MTKVLTITLSVLLGGLFVYAGAIKLADPSILVTDIEGYRLVPYRVAWLGALFLPPFEILCGLALWVPSWRRSGAFALSGLMAVFLFALIAAWARGLDIQCGCFGKAGNDGETNFLWLVGRDLALFAGLVWIAVKRNLDGRNFLPRTSNSESQILNNKDREIGN